MSEKLEGVKQGVPPLSLPGAWSPATLAAIGVRFRCVDKSAGRDLDQLLLSFAPNDVTDIRAPHMKGFVNTMRGNVLYSVQFNIEGHLEDQKQQMCHAPPDVSDTSHYDRVIDVMMKVARNSAKTVTHNLPLGRVRPRTAFIALTEHVAAVLMQLKRGLSTARVYSDLFKSFAQMHQMQLWEGTIFHSSAIIYGQEVTGVPDFVCLRNNKPVAIVKVYADSSNDNNNDSEDPFLEEEAGAAHWTPRRLRTCDNCGRTSTCCSELTFLTSRWSDSSLSDAQLDPSVQGELARDMLATLCRTDLQPYFSNPPRILGVVVEETRVRLASLQVEEEDIAKVKDGVFPAEALTIYYSRPYNILNKVDRTYLFPAFIRLSDQLG